MKILLIQLSSRVHVCNSSTREAKAGELIVRGHRGPWDPVARQQQENLTNLTKSSRLNPVWQFLNRWLHPFLFTDMQGSEKESNLIYSKHHTSRKRYEQVYIKTPLVHARSETTESWFTNRILPWSNHQIMSLFVSETIKYQHEPFHWVTSWVMAKTEFGQEILWPWWFCFMKEPHEVLSTASTHCFLQLHLSLNDQKINHPGVCDMSILHKHFSDFILSLFHSDV